MTLKECPFCGSEAKLVETIAADCVWFSVECASKSGWQCSASTILYGAPERAESQWNIRIPEERARCEKLTNGCEHHRQFEWEKESLIRQGYFQALRENGITK
jgi:hypothetical protein